MIFLFAALFAFPLALFAEPLTLTSSDGIKISAVLVAGKAGPGKLIIVAPGFSQNKDTPIMRRAADILADYGDVLSIDFRGTGQSEGRYHFGAEEQLDLEAAFRWAKPRYHEVELMGFSMGGYIALRAATEFPGFIDRLYLVSTPTHVKAIARSLGPIRQALSLPFKPEVLALRQWAGSDYLFRWGSIFTKKPWGEDLAKNLKVPASLLVGLKDQLVLPEISFKIYNAISGRKAMAAIVEGHHAEYLPVMNESEFRRWFEKSRKKLSAPAKSRP